jgi:hypothetical protein
MKLIYLILLVVAFCPSYNTCGQYLAFAHNFKYVGEFRFASVDKGGRAAALNSVSVTGGNELWIIETDLTMKKVPNIGLATVAMKNGIIVGCKSDGTIWQIGSDGSTKAIASPYKCTKIAMDYSGAIIMLDNFQNIYFKRTLSAYAWQQVDG